MRACMVRFLADEMLGTVAKWLRILGFDTEYAKSMDDAEILEKAVNEGRIILTRDRELRQRAVKSGIAAVYLESAELEEDMRAILKLYPPEPEKLMTRCTICNSELLEVEKEAAKGKVPEGVYERQDRFWYCERCGKIYWKGSHWKKMKEFVRKVEKA